MNLLKIAFLVIIAASIALLLSNQAAALDHPWDDRPTDTTTTTSDVVNGSPDVDGDDGDADEPEDQDYLGVRYWLRWIFGGIESYLIGQKVQQAESKPERGSKHISGKVLKPNFR